MCRAGTTSWCTTWHDRWCASRAALRLGAVVTHVNWGAGGVQVRTRGVLGGSLETLRARAALVTVPLGVLQARSPAEGAIAFVPSLPAAKRAAIDRLAMGNVVKIALRFRDRFGTGWSSPIPRDTGFLHLPGAAAPVWWTFGPRTASLPRRLGGWSGGGSTGGAPLSARARLGGFARSAAARPRLAVSRAGWGPGARALLSAVEDAVVVDWAADVYARGAYSYIPVGGLDAPAELGMPLADRLFFAGEATDTGEPGTVHAALRSGARAARELMAQLAT